MKKINKKRIFKWVLKSGLSAIALFFVFRRVNFPQLHRTIMMFKAWLRGIHHSVLHLQPYIDEYTYRFNRHKMKEGIFENLMKRMLERPPYPYKKFYLSNA